MRRANLRRMKAPTTVARLTCDESTPAGLPLISAKASGAEDTACAAFEGDDGHWQVAIHFRSPPDETGLREVVTVAAGQAAADALRIEPVADSDWVAQSLAGLWPVRAGRLVVHGAHARGGLRANDIGIQIEAARLRHRSSRHDAWLPARARRSHKEAEATASPRCRHRH